MNLLKAIKSIPEFGPVPQEQVQWLIDRCQMLSFQKGESIFEPGDPIDRLIVLFKGSFSFKIQRNKQLQNAGVFKAPSITGLLPYSRASTARAFAVSNEDSEILTLEKDHFRDMICDCHELTTVFVHEMSTRIRRFTKNEQMNDKMISLGKLSAGLAHELNNPSAAVVRSSKELAKYLGFFPEKFKAVIKVQMSDEQMDRINQILFEKVQNGHRHYSMLERSEKEDELVDWLYDHGIEDAEEIADNIVDYGFSVQDFDEIADITPQEHLAPVISWANQLLTTNKLVDEIGDAAERINKLVLSIKSYTHMDQAPEKTPTDIHIGLDNTITMLSHKIKDHHVEIIRNYGKGLPHPPVLPSAINQVWTNIMDNAIDAMEHATQKKLTIQTDALDQYFRVAINDTGTGIPEAIQDKIFDPFFTTKSVGKGTGLGLEHVLEIVKIQHEGWIELKSEPGNTTFTIYLPLI